MRSACDDFCGFPCHFVALTCDRWLGLVLLVRVWFTRQGAGQERAVGRISTRTQQLARIPPGTDLVACKVSFAFFFHL